MPSNAYNDLNMTRERILMVGIFVFVLIVAGWLAWRRFDIPPELHVRITATNGSTFSVGEIFKRGQIIETDANEYIALLIGDVIQIALDERSSFELDRLFEDELAFKFTRGRVIVDARGKTPVLVETNKTQSVIEQGRATFINYDFQRLVTVAPMEGSVQTHIKGTNEYLLLPVPINISEADPPSLSKTVFDPTQGAGAEFHAWANTALTQ